MSKFWDILSKKHKELLAESPDYRRHVANRYFTDPAINDTHGIKRFYLYVASHMAIPDFDDPLHGNPFFVEIEGKRITQDLLHSFLELNFLSRLDFSKIEGVVETGAGYGRTAYVLLKKYVHLKYTIVDIEPALSLSKRFLTQQFPDRDIKFLTPEEAGYARGDLYLFISILSELTREEMQRYLFLAVEHAKYIYIKDWTKYRNADDDFEFYFAKARLNIPKEFFVLKFADCSYPPGFTEGLYGK